MTTKEELYKNLCESADYIKNRIEEMPKIGLILGSGLGSFADELEEKIIIPYKDIPNFPRSTAPGHKGNLVIGKSRGKWVLCMQGRFHYYEGYDMSYITYPIRVMKLLGVEKLLLTNAAGAVNENFEVGDFMLILDHINYMGANPLIGPNDEKFGPRFSDMTHAYNLDMIKNIEDAACAVNIKLRKGVYMAFSGPSYETPAEVKMSRIMGADAVGMSTVPEVIVANNVGIKCAGISTMTNMAAGILDVPLAGDEVVETAERVKPKFLALLEKTIELI